MKKFIILFLFFNSVYAIGQKDSCFYKNYFSYNLTQIFVTELEFSCEYKFKLKQSLKIDLGYRFQLIKYSAGFLPESDSIDLYSHKGYNINIGYNYFIYQSKLGNYQNYISTNILYKYTYSNPIIKVKGEDGQYSYQYYSTFQNKYGLKLIFGHRVIPNKKIKKRSTFIEFYGGLGINREKVNSIFYGNWGGFNPTPSITLEELKLRYPTPLRNITYWKTRLTFHIGIKYGLAWKK